jgi:hypothetical protein
MFVLWKNNDYKRWKIVMRNDIGNDYHIMQNVEDS